MPMPPALAKFHAANKSAKKRASKKAQVVVTEKTVVTKGAKRPHNHQHATRVAAVHRGHGRAHDTIQHMLPTVHEAVGIGAAALYGKLEQDASKSADKSHFLYSVPTPLHMVGRSGNLAIGAWLLGALTKQPLIRAGANGLASIAAYQLMRKTQEYTEANQDFSLQGYSVGARATPRATPRATASARIVDEFLNSNGDDGGDDFPGPGF